ncbi:MAG: crossover junction endodeoxyribonuclease RuvC [Candidatus Omnitrophica bacterium]|nr:crossover junction endodeoxyribonuclease RuvC [Candidatus Omnitrophota bacterium]
MRILGVDPALSVTGYGVIDANNNKISLVEAGVVVTSASQNISMRLNKIHRALAQLISETRPGVMVLEKLYAHYRHPTTAHILGQARGVICLAAAEARIALVEYPATRVKKAIVGKGLAGKYQVQKMVAMTLDIKKLPKYTDVTDALALAIAHQRIAHLDKITGISQ